MKKIEPTNGIGTRYFKVENAESRDNGSPHNDKGQHGRYQDCRSKQLVAICPKRMQIDCRLMIGALDRGCRACVV